MTINKVVIAGAGAIGNYLGIQLYKSGIQVIFLGSQRVCDAVNENGLHMEYPNGQEENYAAGSLTFTTDAASITDAELLIICVKSATTPALIEQLRPFLTQSTTLLTLQNGVSNRKVLQEAFPENTVLAGMVTFNAVEQSATRFRLSTSGEIYYQASDSQDIQTLFDHSGLAAKANTNIQGILWSKLLLNLINPLNALSGRPLKQDLEDRQFRLVWCTCMREGPNALKAAGIHTEKITPLPTSLLPFMISLPNPIYLRLAKNMTDMDPTARTSMAQDLQKGKTTEIDYLTKEIIQMGEAMQIATPVNRAIYNKIKSVESSSEKALNNFDQWLTSLLVF